MAQVTNRNRHGRHAHDREPARPQALPAVIAGAGPVGLAAAAHLIERGVDILIVDAAREVGASPRDWGHVRLFSPWRYNLDRAAVRLLEATGWTAPAADELPTGHELYTRYLAPLAAVPGIRERLRLGRRVVAITRRGLDKVRTAGREDVPFVVRTTSAGGEVEEWPARTVIDATGTWGTPNPLGAAGVAAIGEPRLHDRIHYGIPDVLGADRDRHAGRTTLVVGGGHSAANAVLSLAELSRTQPATTVRWATRGGNLTRIVGGGAADGLPARGQLGTALRTLLDRGGLSLIQDFRIASIREHLGALEVAGTRAGEPYALSGIDVVVAATGQRPDLDIVRELRLSVDAALECVTALAPLIDPNVHSCGTVRPHGARELTHPEPGFFIIGSKSYGRAPTFLLATGYEQARSVAAHIAGDFEAALRVELDLPETGVCSSGVTDSTAAACCAPVQTTAA